MVGCAASYDLLAESGPSLSQNCSEESHGAFYLQLLRRETELALHVNKWSRARATRATGAFYLQLLRQTSLKQLFVKFSTGERTEKKYKNTTWTVSMGVYTFLYIFSAKYIL